MPIRTKRLKKMLKLKLGTEAPPDAAVLAFCTGLSIDIGDHLSLQDKSLALEENLTGMQSRHQAVRLSSDGMADADVVLFNRSLLDRNQKTPIPLPFSWEVGSNTALGRVQMFVVDPAVDAVGGIGADAAAVMKQNFTIIDQNGDEVKDFYFEVDIQGAFVIAGQTRYTATIHVARQSSQLEQYRLRYNAVSGTSTDVLYNFVEAINSTVTLTAPILDINDAVPPGTGLSIILEDDNEVLLIDQGGAALPNTVQTLGLFPDKSTISYEIPGTLPTTTLNIYDGAAIVQTVTLTDKTIEDVVHEINSGSAPIEASILIDGLSASDLLPTGAVIPVPVDTGLAVRLSATYGVRYPNRSKIFSRKPPLHLTTADAWYPRVNTGKIRLNTANSVNLYRIVEYDDQIFSPVHGAGFFDVVDEEPTFSAPRQVLLRYEDIVPESIRLQIGTAIQNNVILDYDVKAGLLYLADGVGELPIKIDYTYSTTDLIYDRLNLNPVSAQNPDAACRFYVIYMIPEKIERIGLSPESYTRTIFHTEAETLQEALDAVDAEAVEVGTNRTLYPVVLAVFQITSDLDINQVKVLDVRTRGGGIRGKPDPQQDESVFYTDIGHLDGEPFPADGPVVLEIPDSVLQTVAASLENDADLVDKRFNEPGNETRETIKGIARRYLAGGTYPLIKTYKR